MSNILLKTGDKASSIGALFSVMGCAACFPAVASFGAAIGLGFLSQWEGLFISILLPVFATIALIINLLGYRTHKQLKRTLFGISGPILALMWKPLMHFGFPWSTAVMYTGIALMLIVSIWDIFSPANKHCADDGCSTDGCSVPQIGQQNENF